MNNDDSIVEFWLDGGEVWCLKKHSGELVFAVINYPIFISNYLIIISFILKNKGLRIFLPVFKDALLADNFRKLKIILKTTVS